MDRKKQEVIVLSDIDRANLKAAGLKLEAEKHDVRWNGDISFTKVVRILLQQKASESK